jgi:hypothetical protein
LTTKPYPIAQQVQRKKRFLIQVFTFLCFASAAGDGTGITPILVDCKWLATTAPTPVWFTGVELNAQNPLSCTATATTHILNISSTQSSSTMASAWVYVPVGVSEWVSVVRFVLRCCVYCNLVVGLLVNGQPTVAKTEYWMFFRLVS